jgi:stearoyl-CoA desaturase (delta-9 desaturase)
MTVVTENFEKEKLEKQEQLKVNEQWEPVPPDLFSKIILGFFVAVPLIGLLVGIPFALSQNWVRWVDIIMLIVLYYISIHGITLGYHRFFTHKAFKTSKGVRITLAIMGSMAVQGRVVDWVADHRKHHQNSDQEEDPHSPWRYGSGFYALLKGLLYAHVGWIFTYKGTDARKYAPDLLKDKPVHAVSRLWPIIAFVTILIPGLIGYMLDGVAGLLMALFWAGLVRIALVHHVTWSINSLTHVFGKQPFKTKDQARNLAWLAFLAGGENWHNYHHADPSSARHGVLPGQLDSSAFILKILEKTNLAYDCKWPSKERIEGKLKTARK